MANPGNLGDFAADLEPINNNAGMNNSIPQVQQMYNSDLLGVGLG